MAYKAGEKRSAGSRRTYPNGHIYYKNSACPVCPICEKQKPAGISFLLELGAPARRALESAGIRTPKELAKWIEAEILKLHGIGPSSIPLLRKTLFKSRSGFQSLMLNE